MTTSRLRNRTESSTLIADRNLLPMYAKTSFKGMWSARYSLLEIIITHDRSIYQIIGALEQAMEKEVTQLTRNNTTLSSGLDRAHEAQNKAEMAFEEWMAEITNAANKQTADFEEKQAEMLREFADWKSQTR